MSSLLFPELHTFRLRIRPFADDDLGPLLALQHHFGDTSPPDTHADWLHWTIASRRQHARLLQPPYGDLAVCRPSSEIVGIIGLVPCLAPFGLLPPFRTRLPPHLYTPEVGLYWAIHPTHRGFGFAAEAADALIDYAFTHLHLARVVACTEHLNLPSIQVMKSLNMEISRAPASAPPWFQTIGHLSAPT